MSKKYQSYPKSVKINAFQKNIRMCHNLMIIFEKS